MKPFLRLLIPLCLCGFTSSLSAQSTWTGATDSNWSTAGNWEPSEVPANNTPLFFGSADRYAVDLGGVARSTGELTFESSEEYTFSYGTLTLDTGTGITQNGSGTLTINSNLTFGGSGARTIGGNGTGTLVLNGVLTRSGGTLNLTGAYEVIFGGNNANSLGNATINVGGGASGNHTTLTFAKTTTAAQNAVAGSATITLTNGTLKILNSDAELNNSIQVGSGNGTIETDRSVTIKGNLTTNASRILTFNNTQKLTFSGNTLPSGSTENSLRIFTLAGFGDVDFNGAMTDTTNGRWLAINKTNTGVFRFNGNNTYTGNTTVAAGALLVNGTTSGQGSFIVNSGTLGGRGIIGLSSTSSVSLTATYAVLAPGDGGAGTLTIDGAGNNEGAGLVLNQGTLVFDLDGDESDKIVLTNFAPGGGGGSSTAGVGGLQFTFLGTVDHSGRVYELIEFASTPGIAINQFALSLESIEAGWEGAFAYNGNTLTFITIPEAGSMKLFLYSAGMAAFWSLRRKTLRNALAAAGILGVAATVQAQSVAIVGDSTVSNYPPERPHCGWGQILSEHAASGVQVHNLAQSGASSKSFFRTTRWREALGKEPTFVLIQFGHNDRAKDPNRGTQPEAEYREYLKRYITEARTAGATPILVTPPVPRAFSAKTGKLGHGRLGPYVEVMKEVGAEENVPVLDLFERTTQWYQSLGPEGAKAYAPLEGDINHYNREGATILAEFVLEEMKEKVPEAAKLFTNPRR